MICTPRLFTVPYFFIRCAENKHCRWPSWLENDYLIYSGGEHSLGCLTPPTTINPDAHSPWFIWTQWQNGCQDCEHLILTILWKIRGLWTGYCTPGNKFLRKILCHTVSENNRNLFKVLLKRFNLNSHTTGFHTQYQRFGMSILSS